MEAENVNGKETACRTPIDNITPSDPFLLIFRFVLAMLV
jgi:hypothetical protein